jgi:hypothetical protein
VKRVLYIIPYLNLFPPKNGGALRNYYLSYELSKYNDLTLLVLQDENEFIDGHEEYNWNKEIKFVKTHRRKESNNLIVYFTHF